MDADTIDISRTLVAKSDQLNADDLSGGPITVKITGINLSGNEDQPVVVQISGGHKPWKPCKTVRRLMSNVWGTNAAKWIGRWITLTRDPKVLWGGKAVGGIRLTHMSGIKQAQTVVLNETSKTKAPHTVEPLIPPETLAPAPGTVPHLRLVIGKALTGKAWTEEQVKVLLVENGAADGKAVSLPAHKIGHVTALLEKPYAPPEVDDDGPPEGTGISEWDTDA
jgi:hypothetical protein